MLMLREVREATKKTNPLERAISFFSPVRAARRMKARAAMALFASYDGASKSKRSLKEWQTFGNDPDTDTLNDLPTLRERSRDLVRNNPIATGALKTKVTNVIGTGLQLHARIDRDVLGMTDEQADVWEANAEREWRLFWDSKDLDAARTLNGLGITRMAYQQKLENGDVFILMPRIKRKNQPYSLRLQIVEADRICNRDDAADTETIAGGIERDAYGAPVAYHITRHHPGNSYFVDKKWDRIEAFGQKTGLRNIIHLFSPTRPGQSRGVPDLSPVIEPLKQLGRYTEAEVMAAVISGMFTVFIEKDGPAPAGFDYSKFGDESGQKSSDKDLKLGNGLIMELNAGEKVHDSDPGRPNANFDPFMMAILRQIGVALQLPFELLIKHFTSSYSAARAALLDLWKFVSSERQDLTDNFLKLIYEVWMYEAVATGRLSAPGFLADPGIRAAYLGMQITGPSMGQIDEVKEVNSAALRVKEGFSTRQDETARITGGDWEKNHRQQVKEENRRKKDGLSAPETKEDKTSQPSQEDIDDER